MDCTPPRLIPLLLVACGLLGGRLAAADGDIRYPSHVRSDEAREAWRIGWPNWLGPGRSCAGIDTGLRLIDDIDDARLVWKSEERVPPVSLYGIRSGFGSPVVAAGRVYLYFTWPTGLSLDPAQVSKEDAKALDTGRSDRTDKSDKPGDDVILCVDALTGKTLWKKVYEGQGQTFLGSGKGGGHYTMTVADGRAYALGSNGLFYCFDAVTGDERWTVDTGHRTALNGTPVVIGPVVAYSQRGTVYAHAVADGKQLWKQGGYGGGSRNHTQLLGWIHEGKGLFLHEGGPAAIDPQTGKELWRIERAHSSANETCIGGPYWILNGNVSGDETQKAVAAGDDLETVSEELYGQTCYRISPQGYEEVWRLPPVFACGGGSPPAIHGDHAYLWGTWVYGRHKQLDGKGPCLKAVVEMATGKVVARWSFPDKYWAYQQVVADGKRYYEGDLSTAAGPESKPLHIKKTRYTAPDTSPAYVCGLLFVRTVDGLACYDLRAR